MEYAPIDRAKQRETIVTVDEELASAAASLGLDLSQIVDRALLAEVKEERARQWKAQNHDAILAWNAWMDKNGLPLDRYRMF